MSVTNFSLLAIICYATLFIFIIEYHLQDFPWWVSISVFMKVGSRCSADQVARVLFVIYASLPHLMQYDVIEWYPLALSNNIDLQMEPSSLFSLWFQSHSTLSIWFSHTMLLWYAKAKVHTYLASIQTQIYDRVYVLVVIVGSCYRF